MKKTFAALGVLSLVLVSSARAESIETEASSGRFLNIRTQPLYVIYKSVGLRADFGVAKKVSVGPQYNYVSCTDCHTRHSVGGQATANITGNALDDGAIIGTDLVFSKWAEGFYATPSLVGGYQWFSDSGISGRLALGAAKAIFDDGWLGGTNFRTDFSIGYAF